MYFWDKHKTITSYYELLSGEVCDRYELTQMEYDILMFLHNNPQHNTAADIVKVRKSTKSHVSTSLKNLENKGLVERIQSKDNKKHIEIILLDKAEIIVKAGINAQKQFANDVLSGLTEEEKHMCIDVFDKICNNAEKYLKEYKEQSANETRFCVKKKTLLLIAGIVWMIAGFNVARLGVLSYLNIERTWYLYFFSLVVFMSFGLMFFKMSQKHTKRILGYEEYRPFWHFFDFKAYLIMICMMSGGIGFRAAGIFPEIFIAFFYSGLGLALALAGIIFTRNYLLYNQLIEKE